MSILFVDVERKATFRKKIFNGPCYICVICNRCLYRKSVVLFPPEKVTELAYEINTNIVSFDGKKYICQTCLGKVRKNKIPCQAVCNKLEFVCIPKELSCLNKLELALIAKRLLFKKIVIMRSGQMPKLKGAVCNVPVSVDETCNSLPRGSDSSGLIFVKLKKKLSFDGHVYFDSVCPERIKCALLYLKVNNKFYKDIEIDIENIPAELLHLDQEEDISIEVEPENDTENIGPDVLNTFRQSASESCFLPPDFNNEFFDIAPGEGKTPHNILLDKHCEELAFPQLFSNGQFGYKVERDIKLSPVKCFNQRLLNYRQNFASDSDYIFFSHFVLQQHNLCSQINIAMKKAAGNVTAGMLCGSTRKTVQSMVASDQGYIFMNTIKGSPAYWKRFQLEVLAMIRQLGCPTFFLTLSAADLQWNELVHLLTKLDGQHLTDEEIQNLSYFERCKILNSNPVFVARDFQYRVEIFFTEILVGNDATGKLKYYAIRVEFQFRGSAHIHSFLWILNPPVLTNDTMDVYIKFVDDTVQAVIPNEATDKDLYVLVKKYQTHSHSKSCMKYKNSECRYHFGRYFTERTIIAKPISSYLSNDEKGSIIAKRSSILSQVRNYINNNLNPNKSSYEGDKSITEILGGLEISETDYYESLAISTSSDFEIHLKRFPNACFVNNYNPTILKAWQANMDLQPVFNYYKAVSYMCAYFSKSETESSEALKQAAKEAKTMKLNTREAMYKVASAFATSRQVSVQESIYCTLPELWLRKCFPKTVFVNTNIPSEREVFVNQQKSWMNLILTALMFLNLILLIDIWTVFVNTNIPSEREVFVNQQKSWMNLILTALMFLNLILLIDIWIGQIALFEKESMRQLINYV